MSIKIEKNIPIPAPSKGKAKYPWDKLEVGESFSVAKKTNGRQLCIQASMTRHPKKFESRIVNGKCRVWRTA